MRSPGPLSAGDRIALAIAPIQLRTLGGGLSDSPKRGSEPRAAGPEQYQQRGRGRRPQCRSAAIAGGGRLDALADPRLASERLADPRRDHWPACWWPRSAGPS